MIERIGARGIVFFVIGGSLVLAGVKHNLDAAHGVYALVNARYRRITT
ncbi:MAG: hypothetical protein ACXW5U_30345 [Thermoanaerobaculia bacterium]